MKRKILIRICDNCQEIYQEFIANKMHSMYYGRKEQLCALCDKDFGLLPMYKVEPYAERTIEPTIWICYRMPNKAPELIK